MYKKAYNVEKNRDAWYLSAFFFLFPLVPINVPHAMSAKIFLGSAPLPMSEKRTCRSNVHPCATIDFPGKFYAFCVAPSFIKGRTGD